MNRKIPLSEHQNIENRHVNLKEKPSFIAKTYGVNENQICRILKQRGCLTRSTARRYFFNQDFFEKIDTEEKAYFLGLIYSDGNVHNIQMRLCTSEPDQYLLEKLREIITNSPPLKILKKRKSFHKQKFVLELTSRKMVSDLFNLGVIPNKSLILKFPTPEQIPDDLMNHFIRGVFDGDGNFYVSKKNGATIAGITGSPFFIPELAKFIENKLGIKTKVTGYSHSKAMDVKMASRPSIIFMDYLYKNASIKMQRKYVKFIEKLNTFTNKSISKTCGSITSVEKLIDIVKFYTGNKLEKLSFGRKKSDRIFKINQPVYQYDKEGNFIKEWSNGCHEAAKSVGGKGLHIYVTAKGQNNSSSGFQWKFYKKDKIDAVPKRKSSTLNWSPSPETRMKMSLAKKGKPRPPRKPKIADTIIQNLV